MSDLIWHIKLAYFIMSIGEQEQKKCHIHTSAYAALRAFEEVIDAYCSIKDLHFHILYQENAWKERTKLMESDKSIINLMGDWNNMVSLYSLISLSNINSQKHLEKMIEIVKRYLVLFDHLKDF